MVRRGLFLDLDGTLADSLAAMEEAYRTLLRQFGCDGSTAEFQSLNGPPAPVIVERIRKTHALTVSTEDLLPIYRELVAQAHSAAPPAAGARDVLERARALGWIAAVVTSAANGDARAWLARVGLTELVAAVVGGDDVRHGKPAPEPYLVALQRTGCAPDVSLAIEDSPMGAQAAMAAGLPTWLLDRDSTPNVDGPLFRGRIGRFGEVAALLTPDAPDAMDQHKG